MSEKNKKKVLLDINGLTQEPGDRNMKLLDSDSKSQLAAKANTARKSLVFNQTFVIEEDVKNPPEKRFSKICSPKCISHVSSPKPINPQYINRASPPISSSKRNSLCSKRIAQEKPRSNLGNLKSPVENKYARTCKSSFQKCKGSDMLYKRSSQQLNEHVDRKAEGQETNINKERAPLCNNRFIQEGEFQNLKHLCTKKVTLRNKEIQDNNVEALEKTRSVDSALKALTTGKTSSTYPNSRNSYMTDETYLLEKDPVAKLPLNNFSAEAVSSPQPKYSPRTAENKIQSYFKNLNSPHGHNYTGVTNGISQKGHPPRAVTTQSPTQVGNWVAAAHRRISNHESQISKTPRQKFPYFTPPKPPKNQNDTFNSPCAQRRNLSLSASVEQLDIELENIANKLILSPLIYSNSHLNRPFMSVPAKPLVSVSRNKAKCKQMNSRKRLNLGEKHQNSDSEHSAVSLATSERQHEIQCSNVTPKTCKNINSFLRLRGTLSHEKNNIPISSVDRVQRKGPKSSKQPLNGKVPRFSNSESKSATVESTREQLPEIVNCEADKSVKTRYIKNDILGHHELNENITSKSNITYSLSKLAQSQKEVVGDVKNLCKRRSRIPVLVNKNIRHVSGKKMTGSVHSESDISEETTTTTHENYNADVDTETEVSDCLDSPFYWHSCHSNIDSVSKGLQTETSRESSDSDSDFVTRREVCPQVNGTEIFGAESDSTVKNLNISSSFKKEIKRTAKKTEKENFINIIPDLSVKELTAARNKQSDHGKDVCTPKFTIPSSKKTENYEKKQPCEITSTPRRKGVCLLNISTISVISPNKTVIESHTTEEEEDNDEQFLSLSRSQSCKDKISETLSAPEDRNTGDALKGSSKKSHGSPQSMKGVRLQKILSSEDEIKKFDDPLEVYDLSSTNSDCTLTSSPKKGLFKSRNSSKKGVRSPGVKNRQKTMDRFPIISSPVREKHEITQFSPPKGGFLFFKSKNDRDSSCQTSPQATKSECVLSPLNGPSNLDTKVKTKTKMDTTVTIKKPECILPKRVTKPTTKKRPLSGGQRSEHKKMKVDEPSKVDFYISDSDEGELEASDVGKSIVCRGYGKCIKKVCFTCGAGCQ